MKTKITIAISILIGCLLPGDTSAQGGEKIYQITAEGKYQFVYTQDYLNGTGIIHPITARTFYLETKRLGLMPAAVSYAVFLQYPAEQLQAMLESEQADFIASLNNSPEFSVEPEATFQATATSIPNGNSEQAYFGNCESGICPTKHVSEEASAHVNAEHPEETPQNKRMTWMATALTQPGKESVPGLTRREATLHKDTTYTQVRTKIPWIVQLMLMEGEMPYENWYDSENVPALTATEADKRIRMHDLVTDLLTYQDDSVQRQFGKVFPGMDGKLYGISDAELDEVIQALLTMKEEFLSSSQPALQDIFNELETLAMGK